MRTTVALTALSFVPDLTFGFDAGSAATLTALSFVPDLTFGFDAGSASTLITLHTVAAAVVVPTLARRLARGRGPCSPS